MKILVLNSGSSSIKYSLYDMNGMRVVASGVIERIGEPHSLHKYRVPGADGTIRETSLSQTAADHRQGLAHISQVLRDCGAVRAISALSCIGHRVVHGGERFHQPTLINQEVLQDMRKMIPLAPLHNPANLMGIEVTVQYAPNIPQVAVFDTAFHQSMPAHAFHYALPGQLYEREHVRRYGFHGTSHHYVAKQAARLLNRPLQSLNLITLHLGNGASATAIQQGESVDTSMGMTPLEGLVMGTRSGDIDPAIPFFLSRHRGLSNEKIESMLNQQSGLKGLCGEGDMRSVHRLADAGDQRAQLALDIYCYRIKKYIGAYYAVLGQIDALVFTGGIGENDAKVRSQACSGLEAMGIAIDPQKNSRTEDGNIDLRKQGSAVGVLVIPTNEELEIAVQSMECIRRTTSSHLEPPLAGDD